MMVGGVRLETAWHGPPPGPGPGTAPSFVLLHEGLGCVSTWRDFPARLARRTGFGVLVVSRAGYGRSDPAPLPRPPRYFHDEACTVLPALLDAAELGDCVLLGHSDGGTIAALHAGLCPDPRVRRIVLIAPHFFAEERTLAGVRAAQVAMQTGGLGPRLRRHHGDNTRICFEGWRDLWLSPGMRHWEAGAALEALRMPVLMIQGKDDAYGTLEQVEYLRRHAPQAEALILAECGHVPHLEQPGPVLDAIATFVGAG